MKIENNSHWDSEDIRRLVRLCVKKSAIDKESLRYVIVETGRRKYGGIGYSGTAYRFGRRITMRVPMPSKTTFDTKQFSQIMMHELDHIRGLSHGDMIEHNRIDVSWVDDFEVKPRQPKPKKVRNLKQERYEHVLKLIKKNERKLKSTQTRLKSLYKKKRYYEKKVR